MDTPDKSLSDIVAEQETVGLLNALRLESNAKILPEKGAELGPGIVTGVLGKGGAAIVYEIMHSELHVPRAIKLLRPDHNPRSLLYFENEKLITASLHHPNISVIHSTGKFRDLPYLEMELVDGCTLSQFLKERGALPAGASCAIALSICKALSYAHRKQVTIGGTEYAGILHCDLKPGNVMISTAGTVKIMDFGIAIPFQTSQARLSGKEPLGSMSYLAPEQLQPAGPLDGRADIFSLGCILYEMLTREKVFSAANPVRLEELRRSGITPKLDFGGRPFPQRLTRLILSCLQIEPDQRPSSVDLVGKEIEAIMGRLSPRSPEEIIVRYLQDEKVFTSSRPERFDQGRMLRAAMLAVLPVLAVIAGMYLFHDKPYLRRNPYALKSSDAGGETTVSPSSSVMPAPDRDSRLAQIVRSNSSVSLPELYRREARKGNYESVLMLHGLLAPSITRSRGGQLLWLRSAAAMDSIFRRFMEMNEIDDAEFYILKAKLYFEKGEYGQALTFLDIAGSKQALLMDTTELRQQSLLFQARCRTALFMNDPDSLSYTSAIRSWTGLLKEIRYDPQHPFTAEAEKAMSGVIRTAGGKGIR
jgi:serine/threonine protein kinase